MYFTQTYSETDSYTIGDKSEVYKKENEELEVEDTVSYPFPEIIPVEETLLVETSPVREVEETVSYLVPEIIPVEETLPVEEILLVKTSPVKEIKPIETTKPNITVMEKEYLLKKKPKSVWVHLF